MAYNTNQDRLSHKTVTNLEQSLGKHGLNYYNNTDIHTGLNGVAIQAITQAAFTTLTLSGQSLDGITLAAGTIIYGHVTNVTLSQGSIIVYNA